MEANRQQYTDVTTTKQIPTHLRSALKRINSTIPEPVNGTPDPLDDLSPIGQQALRAITATTSRCISGRSLIPLTTLAKRLRNAPLTDGDKGTLRQEYLRLKQLTTESLNSHNNGASETTDPAWWHSYILDGVSTGQQHERLSEASPAMRDLLQISRVVGGQLAAPHYASGDPTPQHLRLPSLMKAFGCDAATAKTIRIFFEYLEAGPGLIKAYAAQTKTRGLATVWLELRKWADVVAAESPAKNDAMERPLTEHRDGDEEEEVFTGSYEPVEYHRVPDSQTQEARQFTHALVEELKQCPREQLPALQKTIWQRQ